MSEENQAGRIVQLTRANYQAWLSQVKDLILSLDHDEAADIWQAYSNWDPATPIVDAADEDYQNAVNASAKKLRHLHNKAYRMIRLSLSSEVFDTTLELDTHVPQLLRHIRKWWHSNSIYDRIELIEEYEEMRLGQYQDMEVYQTAFKNKVRIMRDYHIGLVSDDETVLYSFEKHLPAAYKEHINLRIAQAMTYTNALTFYATVARKDKDLPGAIRAGVKSSTDSAHRAQARDTSHASIASPRTKEVCRAYAKGRNCRYGDKCRFLHTELPPTAQAAPPANNNSNRRRTPHCFFCGKDHYISDCVTLNAIRKDTTSDEGKYDSTHFTGGGPSNTQQDSNSESGIVFGDAAFATTDYVRVTKADLQPRTSSTPGSLVMLVDGASTCIIVQDERLCTDIRPANIDITVGGDTDKPPTVKCSKVGRFTFNTVAEGRAVTNWGVARICPSFGCDILPECFYLKRKFSVNKTYTTLEVRTPVPQQALVMI